MNLSISKDNKVNPGLVFRLVPFWKWAVKEEAAYRVSIGKKIISRPAFGGAFAVFLQLGTS